MAKLVADLSARAIAALPVRKGIYRVAPDLYVDKSRPGAGTWVFRYVSPVKHRRVEMGLGPVRDPALKGSDRP